MQGQSDVSRVVDPTSKELAYNPKYEELYAPVQGPDNPYLTTQQRAQRNTLSGFVEKAHISAFNFENQRRTFHTYGYALDPSVNTTENDGQTFVGDIQTAYDTNGKTVFESPRPKKKRKQERNDNPEDIEGFSGPWGKYENEEEVARPNEQQKAELDEILAKRHRRNRIPEDKPLEEKSILHSKLPGKLREKFSSLSKFILIFYISFLFNSQRSIGLSRALIFTCTARCWRESAITFTSRQMFPTKIAYTHLDGAHKRNRCHTITTENGTFTAVRQYGLSCKIMGSLQRATMHSHIFRASASGQRCWIQ